MASQSKQAVRGSIVQVQLGATVVKKLAGAERGKRNKTEVQGPQKANVPEDKLVVSNMIQSRSDKGDARDRYVRHPLRNANPAIRMIQDADPAIRMVNKLEPAPQERQTNRCVFKFEQGK